MSKPQIDVDQMLTWIVDQIWGNYDQDRSGMLNLSETKNLILETITILSGGKEEEVEDKWNDIINFKQFTELFNKIDEDASGTVTKDELIKFIKLIVKL